MSSEDKSASKGGLLDSVKNLAATLIGMGQTRLELISTEVEEELERLSAMLIWTFTALFCAALVVLLGTLLIVVYYWDTYRLMAISTMLLIFIIAAGLAWRVVFNMSKDRPRIFSATLAELSKDQAQLTTRNEQ